MANLTPFFATARTGARLMDMKPAEFLALVDAGHLPKPVQIGGHERWDTNELKRIAGGAAALGEEMEF